METDAIRSGFEHLKDGRGYDTLYHSALCRAKADWLIGINATRLFSCLYGKTLNVGRVQTPTLKMLVDRDAAITNFKKETYYHVRLMLPGAEAASAKICAADEAGKLKAACEASAAVCTSLVKEKKTIAPPKLFDLTSLQRETNRIYGYTAKQTLDLAQTLYEKKLLTYPRTDSAFLTDDMGETATGIIALLCGKLPFMAGVSFTPEVSRVLNSKKVSDHHAIIPTMELAKADLTALPESERNILTLAGARLLMATAEPYSFEAVTAVFSCADHEFTAKGKAVIAAGWKDMERLYRVTLKKKPDSDDENELVLDLQEKGLTDEDTLNQRIAKLEAKYHDSLAVVKDLEGRMKTNNELRYHIAAYTSTKNVAQQLKTAKRPAVFEEQHRAELTAYRAAAAYFKANNLTKLPSPKKLEAEYAQLASEKAKFYEQYKEAKEELLKLKTAKQNVASFFREEEQTQQER